MRATGWKADRIDRSHGHPRVLYGITPPMFAEPDLTRFAPPRAFQRGASSCVAFWMAWALRTWAAARGHAIPEPSEQHLYWIARREEFVDKPPPWPDATDDGCEPGLMLQAVTALGFVPRTVCPYDPDTVNVQPPDGAAVGAISQRGLRWYRPIEAGTARIVAIEDALLRGLPVGFGMPVDGAYLRHRGDDTVTDVELRDFHGNHCQGIVAIDREHARAKIVNWWDDWGMDDGAAWLSLDLLASPLISNVSIVQAVPPMVAA